MLVVVLALPRAAYAHAVLVKSIPQNNGTVHSGGTVVELTYNSRIDATRSSLNLAGPDGAPHALTLKPGSSPNVLSAAMPSLTPGAYQLQWQVLATDGHITRGIVKFRVE